MRIMQRYLQEKWSLRAYWIHNHYTNTANYSANHNCDHLARACSSFVPLLGAVGQGKESTTQVERMIGRRDVSTMSRSLKSSDSERNLEEQSTRRMNLFQAVNDALHVAMETDER